MGLLSVAAINFCPILYNSVSLSLVVLFSLLLSVFVSTCCYLS